MTRKERIEQILTKTYAPIYLQVDDESQQHHVPLDAQTHYKIIVVTQNFASLSRVQRHRLINTLLHNEFQEGLHALSMHLYTPEEWEDRKNAVQTSPHCKDGYKNR